ncbi:MAG: glycosyltransferase [Planctomycetes bacterium]|nr:glycosyltransferase [Planctomycetota bacterium]
MTVLSVLHVVPHLDRVGGYERQALALARQQRRSSTISPILLTHADGGRPLLEKLAAGDVHRLRRGLLRHHPGSWWRRHGAGVEIVHAHGMHKLTGQLVAAAVRDGVPALVKVATEDDVRMFADPEAWIGPLDGDESAPHGMRWRAMVRTAWRRLRRAGTFVALNASIERQLREHGLHAVRVPNGVDVERFRPPTPAERDAARGELGISGNERVVAYVGRLATRKDVICLTEAFVRVTQRIAARRIAHVVATRPRGGSLASSRALLDDEEPLRLLVVGDGLARAEVERLMTEAGRTARSTFLGERDDVRPALWAADLFVHPSRREGLPNAVLEAWACRLPTVLSDIPGHRDASAGYEPTPDEPCALFFPPGDAEALASRLNALLGDASARASLAAAGLQRARTVFPLERVSATYAEIYAELLARTRGAGG